MKVTAKAGKVIFPIFLVDSVVKMGIGRTWKSFRHDTFFFIYLFLKFFFIVSSFVISFYNLKNNKEIDKSPSIFVGWFKDLLKSFFKYGLSLMLFLLLFWDDLNFQIHAWNVWMKIDVHFALLGWFKDIVRLLLWFDDF